MHASTPSYTPSRTAATADVWLAQSAEHGTVNLRVTCSSATRYHSYAASKDTLMGAWIVASSRFPAEDD